MFLSIVISLEILISRQLLTGRGRRREGETERRRKRGGVGPAVVEGKGERGPRGTGRDEEEIGGEEGNGEVEGKGARGPRKTKYMTKKRKEEHGRRGTRLGRCELESSHGRAVLRASDAVIPTEGARAGPGRRGAQQQRGKGYGAFEEDEVRAESNKE